MATSCSAPVACCWLVADSSGMRFCTRPRRGPNHMAFMPAGDSARLMSACSTNRCWPLCPLLPERPVRANGLGRAPCRVCGSISCTKSGRSKQNQHRSVEGILNYVNTKSFLTRVIILKRTAKSAGIHVIIGVTDSRTAANCQIIVIEVAGCRLAGVAATDARKRKQTQNTSSFLLYVLVVYKKKTLIHKQKTHTYNGLLYVTSGMLVRIHI